MARRQHAHHSQGLPHDDEHQDDDDDDDGDDDNDAHNEFDSNCV